MASDAELQVWFGRVIAEHGPALRRLARSYALSQTDGDDLYQEICFAIWRALPSFRGEASIRTFVFRIGHNRGLTHRARRKPDPTELDESVADGQPGPETLLRISLRRQRLVSAVAQLPEGYRRVVAMSLEGLETAEIAEVLGVSDNSVAIRLTRARKMLRALMGEAGGGDGQDD